MGGGKKIGTCEGWGMIHERLVFAQAHKKGKEPERNYTDTLRWEVKSLINAT